MAGQYSHLQFFRHAPNALLACYFQEMNGVLQEITLDKLKDEEVEPTSRLVTVLILTSHIRDVARTELPSTRHPRILVRSCRLKRFMAFATSNMNICLSI